MPLKLRLASLSLLQLNKNASGGKCVRWKSTGIRPCIQSGLRNLRILMRPYSTYADSTNELTIRINRQTPFDRHGSSQAEIAHPALRKMILPCFGRAAKCYGGTRFLNRNFNAAKLGIVEAQQVDEITSIIDDGDYNRPLIASGFRL